MLLVASSQLDISSFVTGKQIKKLVPVMIHESLEQRRNNSYFGFEQSKKSNWYWVKLT